MSCSMERNNERTTTLKTMSSPVETPKPIHNLRDVLVTTGWMVGGGKSDRYLSDRLPSARVLARQDKCLMAR